MEGYDMVQDLKKDAAGQCHRCRFNDMPPTDEKREACHSCQLKEIYPKPYYPASDPRTEALIAEHGLVEAPEERYFDDPDDPADENTPAPLSDASPLGDFASHFFRLHFRTQLVALGLLNFPGCNDCIAKAAHMSRTTVIEHRKRLEADPYWSRVLRSAGIPRRRTRRRRSTAPGPRRSHDAEGRLVAAGGTPGPGRGPAGEVTVTPAPLPCLARSGGAPVTNEN